MAKYSKKFLDKKHDELYEKASKVLEKYNPCNVIDGVCSRGRAGGINYCCQAFGLEPQCKYLGDNGCTVQALHCRLWHCGYHNLGELYADFNSEMDAIYREANKYGLLGFRKSKEEEIELALRKLR